MILPECVDSIVQAAADDDEPWDDDDWISFHFVCFAAQLGHLISFQAAIAAALTIVHIDDMMMTV